VKNLTLLRLSLAFVIAFIVLSFRARADDAPKVKAPAGAGKCMMWKVSSETATVYLVGSMHLATPDLYPLPKEMEEAFAKSDVLTVEININKMDQQKMAAKVQQKGMYVGDESLSKNVSKETWDSVKTACANLGLPPDAVEKMKPWTAGLVIEVVGIQKLGFDPNLGIDKHFLDLADKNGKKVDELETADFQIDMLSGFDAKLQEKALVATLEEIKDLKKDIGKMKDKWAAGDVKGLVDFLDAKDKLHPELDVISKKLIDDRNGPMAEKVEAYLKGNKTVFVVAGIAHMVGDKGIIKTLEDHKFKVEQSKATKAKETE
jgi:uncharacterized protein YbaP (TraB family)